MNRTRVLKFRALHPLWLAPIVVAMSFLVVGCYTILKHPITADGEQAEAGSHQEYYRGQCLDCHQDYASYPYGFFYGEYPDYYFEYPRWGHYYAYPWWWDKLWYETSGDGTTSDAWSTDSGGEVVDGQKAPRRGGMVPPYVGGAAVTNYGGSGYQYGGSSSGGGTGYQQGTGTTPPAVPATGLKSKSGETSGTTPPTEAGGTPQLKGKADTPTSFGSGTINVQKPGKDSTAARPLEPKVKKSKRR
ncbi:MAG: hypothetical protein HZB43_06020 [candidate division Zixibacteria bacterium]|nr:hypothetical protein [candidate division Zixibacteria bacterium]